MWEGTGGGGGGNRIWSKPSYELSCLNLSAQSYLKLWGYGDKEFWVWGGDRSSVMTIALLVYKMSPICPSCVYRLMDVLESSWLSCNRWARESSRSINQSLKGVSRSTCITPPALPRQYKRTAHIHLYNSAPFGESIKRGLHSLPE